MTRPGLLAAALVLFAAATAEGQGLYMLNGRATPSAIAGPDGAIYPVVPGPHFAGPSPIYLAPPPPLGWVYGPFTVCADPPDCRAVVVSVEVDGINVRATPSGPVVAALANGVPVLPLRQDGMWVLVAPACPLAPTFTYSVTAGGVPLSVCGF